MSNASVTHDQFIYYVDTNVSMTWKWFRSSTLTHTHTHSIEQCAVSSYADQYVNFDSNYQVAARTRCEMDYHMMYKNSFQQFVSYTRWKNWLCLYFQGFCLRFAIFWHRRAWSAIETFPLNLPHNYPDCMAIIQNYFEIRIWDSIGFETISIMDFPNMSSSLNNNNELVANPVCAFSSHLKRK